MIVWKAPAAAYARFIMLARFKGRPPAAPPVRWYNFNSLRQAFCDGSYPMRTSTYDEVFRLFVLVLRREVSLAAFATWLYEHSDIALATDSDIDEQLLAIDYLQPAATGQVDTIMLAVLQGYRRDLYDDEHIRRLLCGIALGSADIVAACAELGWYHNSGYDWIPVSFTGIASELDAADDDGVPWVAQYKDMARSEAQKLIDIRYATIPCR